MARGRARVPVTSLLLSAAMSVEVPAQHGHPPRRLFARLARWGHHLQNDRRWTSSTYLQWHSAKAPGLRAQSSKKLLTTAIPLTHRDRVWSLAASRAGSRRYITPNLLCMQLIPEPSGESLQIKHVAVARLSRHLGNANVAVCLVSPSDPLMEPGTHTAQLLMRGD